MRKKITKSGQKSIGRTDMERLRLLKDDQIDYTDIPEVPSNFWGAPEVCNIADEIQIKEITVSDEAVANSVNLSVSMGYMHIPDQIGKLSLFIGNSTGYTGSIYLPASPGAIMPTPKVPA